MTVKVEAKIQKWGNGLAIRISGLMRDIPHFKEGTPIEVKIFEHGLEIRKIHKKRQHLPFTEAELLKGMTPKTAHVELLAKPLEGEY